MNACPSRRGTRPHATARLRRVTAALAVVTAGLLACGAVVPAASAAIIPVPDGPYGTTPAAPVPVITVGGTNGKGSTCAMLESILAAAGYRTALYTSPHLLRYNERVRIGAREADDAALCEAFAAVEGARGQTPLTYFEYGTLAALWLFAREKIEAARRDLDDLAKTRESIARERDELTEKSRALAADKMRLAALIDARQQSLASAQDAMGSQQQRATELAKRATSLRDLIARLDSENAARKAANRVVKSHAGPLGGFTHGDAADAQKYYNQLPQQDRAAMKTRCDRYGVTFTDPPATQ